jgi:hypothetical protein
MFLKTGFINTLFFGHLLDRETPRLKVFASGKQAFQIEEGLSQEVRGLTFLLNHWWRSTRLALFFLKLEQLWTRLF